ncbi:hypothetical protein [Novosphingobium sp. 9]|uniref:hypothetical protein n=1 Tax=Novosphingobium sp. 9 TaxID=2025349 RepID=UPI0021B6E56B|nr:hypothetical protein [Novosphingobium sp. 9]
MRPIYLIAGASLAMTSAFALAQSGPESLLPKAFEDPAPQAAPSPRATQRPKPAPRAVPKPAAPKPVVTASAPSAPAAPRPAPVPVATASPVVQPLPGITAPAAPSDQPTNTSGLSRIPTLDELARMTPDDFDALLGTRTLLDMPPAARRKLDNVGLIDAGEGGLAADSLSRANASMIRIALSANKGTLVSRWGHILLRQALASRLAPPPGMDPVAFAAMRVDLLLRMGEPDAARAVLQDVDIPDYTPTLASIALNVYTQNADFTGMCPAMSAFGNARQDAQWNAARDICMAYRGNAQAALQRLDSDMNHGRADKIDLLLAQKYVGAAGRGRRAVTIEWGDVTSLTPWRYALAIGTGLEPPASLMKDAGTQYASMTALAPMVGLERRAEAADYAGATGVLSSAAMVDLYGQIYEAPEVTGVWQDRATSLRSAYTDQDPATRLSAMQSLWKVDTPEARYARLVLTAAAAARMTPGKDMDSSSGDLIASMLAAGYDANAMRWASVVEPGSLGWALVTLADANGGGIDSGAVSTFSDADKSAEHHRTALFIAALAGLGRIDSGDASRYSRDMNLGLDSPSRFTDAIDAAAARGDSAGVAILAGFGMQGSDWAQMTPRYFLHILSALRSVGLEAQARMIAAEAVARS